MHQYDLKIVNAHISDIYVGDTVIYDGHIRTLTRADFATGFVGNTIYGDSYKLGLEPVQLVLFPRFRHGEYVGHYRGN